MGRQSTPRAAARRKLSRSAPAGANPTTGTGLPELPIPGRIAAIRVDPPAQGGQAGLPDALRSGIEQLTGVNLDEVRVHYNSDRPRALNALAFAQGSDIYLAPGGESRLPHEAWHVVQQSAGRVRPTVAT